MDTISRSLVCCALSLVPRPRLPKLRLWEAGPGDEASCAIDIILPTDWDWTLGISVYTARCAGGQFCPWIQRDTA